MSLHTSSALLHVLFVPHGSPMFALNPGGAGAAMRTYAPNRDESDEAHKQPNLVQENVAKMSFEKLLMARTSVIK